MSGQQQTPIEAKSNMENIEKLWAEYGKLQAQREQLQAGLNMTINKLREVYAKIQAAEKQKDK